MSILSNNTIKQYTLLLGILPYFFIVFIKDNTFITDIYYFISITSILAISMLFSQIISYKKINLNITLIDLAVALLAVYFAINALFVSKIPANHIIYRKIICFFIFLIISTHIFKIKRNINIYLLFLIFITIPYCILSLLKLNDPKLTQSNAFQIQFLFRNPALSAAYLGSIIPTCISFILYSKHRLIKEVCCVSSFLILIILFYSYSRAAWLSTVAGIVIVLLYKFDFHKILSIAFKHSKRITLAILITIFTCSFFLLLCIFNTKPTSVYGRMLIYKLTIKGIIDKPLIGNGYETFSKSYSNIQANYFSKTGSYEPEQLLASNNNTAFNEYLQTTFETGIIGLLGITLIIIIIVKNRRIIKSAETIGAMGAFISLLINACFSYPFHSTPILCLSITFLGIINSQYKSWIIPISKQILVISVVSMCLILIINSQNIYYLNKWKNIAELYIDRDFESYSEEYFKLSKKLNANPYFLYNYGVELTLNGKSQEAISILNMAKHYYIDTDLLYCLGEAYQNQNDFINAEKQFLLAWHIVPHKFYPLYRLALLYKENGDYQKAYNMAEKILKTKEKIKSYEIDIMKNEMQILRDSLYQVYSFPK